MVRGIGLSALAGLLALAGCTLSPTPGAPSATPLRTAEFTASVQVIPSAEPSATPTAAPSTAARREDIPVYAAGSMVETFAPGLRVRARPGTDQRVLTGLLPEGAELLVILGPVWVDELGWYLVRDEDRAEPRFSEGWVAAGFDPDPFLAPTVFDVDDNPVIAGFAHDADGEFGPVRLGRGDHAIRWIAAPLTPEGCGFGVDLLPPEGQAVPAIRATVGAVPAPGVLPADFFASRPELRGDVFVQVTSGCSWALTFVRVES